MYDLTPIFETLIALIGAVITAFVVPYIKSKTTVQQQTAILALIKIAVAAAEQMFGPYGFGKEKKEYVVEWLNARGVKIDADKLDAMIESAVYELNLQKGA